MRKLGFENMKQVVICTLVFGGMIGFVVYGLMVNVI
jgi:predicted branched-subunit amino acid permease